MERRVQGHGGRNFWRRVITDLCFGHPPVGTIDKQCGYYEEPLAGGDAAYSREEEYIPGEGVPDTWKTCYFNSWAAAGHRFIYRHGIAIDYLDRDLQGRQKATSIEPGTSPESDLLGTGGRTVFDPGVLPSMPKPCKTSRTDQVGWATGLAARVTPQRIWTPILIIGKGE